MLIGSFTVDRKERPGDTSVGTEASFSCGSRSLACAAFKQGLSEKLEKADCVRLGQLYFGKG